MLTVLLNFVLQVPVTESGLAGTFSSYTRGVQRDFNVTHGQSAQSPAWPEADPWPPLSPRRAIELAWEQLGTLVVDVERWRFDSLSLKQVDSKRTWI